MKIIELKCCPMVILFNKYYAYALCLWDIYRIIKYNK